MERMEEALETRLSGRTLDLNNGALRQKMKDAAFAVLLEQKLVRP